MSPTAQECHSSPQSGERKSPPATKRTNSPSPSTFISQEKPRKSILKKPKSSSPKVHLDHSIVERAKATQAALVHANILEERKRQESHILDYIIELSSDFPTAIDHASSKCTDDDDQNDDSQCSRQKKSSKPSKEDMLRFKSLVRIFQPGDYNSLLEERNVNGLCGYPLCHNPRLRIPGGNWTFHNNAIIEKKELEKWCSEECARRAMYVKVQLLETASWERAGIPNIRIDLLEEKGTKNGGVHELEERMDSLELDESVRAREGEYALASERRRSAGVEMSSALEVTIKEKTVKVVAEAPTLKGDGSGNSNSHAMIEGYKTTIGKLPGRG